jgi:transcriptional regulator with XRE-family HTH domain
MTELSVGLWLRHERERRGITLRQIADQTKVAAPLLEGLEAGDLSRWPGGIYRRAFVKSYAAALGLETDEVVRRFEAEHPPDSDDPRPLAANSSPALSQPAQFAPAPASAPAVARTAMRGRLIGTAADLTVALVLGLGSAAAGSRLLWPVLFIALYYALGVLITGTSPMVALLADDRTSRFPAPEPEAPAESSVDASRSAQRPLQDRRTTRRVSRAQRASKGPRPPRVQ